MAAVTICSDFGAQKNKVSHCSHCFPIYLPLVSVIHQYESAIGIPEPPPSWTSLSPPAPSHPSRLSQSTWFELLASYSKFLLAIYFTYDNVYVSMLLYQFVPRSPFLRCPQVCSLCLHHYCCPENTFISTVFWALLVAQLAKNLPSVQETSVQFLGHEDLLKKR